MEKLTYTVIDYNSEENMVIEDRVREYYPQVKALIERVITKRLRYQNIPHGLCNDFIEEDKKLWNRFLALPINHPMERDEMAIKIHDIQRMIISRPGFRLNQEMFNQYGKGNSDKG